MMKTPIWFLIPLMLVMAALAWMLFFSAPETPSVAVPMVDAPAAPLATTPVPEVRFPVPEAETNVDDSAAPVAAPLPPLGESDPAFRAALLARYGEVPLGRWLMPNALIPRIVVSLDSLDQPASIALRMRPLAHVPGLFVVAGEGRQLAISEDNARRYDPYVELLMAVDADALAALYFGYYPLFQQAYEDLGYPGLHFNDRVVDILDHLLETPVLAAPPALKRPKVLYQFADAETEARSWGQKTLIRIGPAHQRQVMQQLDALRTAITRVPGAATRVAADDDEAPALEANQTDALDATP